MTIQISLLLPLAVLLGGCGSSDSTADVEKGVSQSVSQPKIETKDANDGNIIIEQIESQITLPEGAYDLGQYDRYYILNGDAFIATYIRSSDSTGSVYVVGSRQDIPDLLDGGCQVVHVSGKVSTPENASTFCNGVA